jgi:hypothetical protein
MQSRFGKALGKSGGRGPKAERNPKLEIHKNRGAKFLISPRPGAGVAAAKSNCSHFNCLGISPSKAVKTAQPVFDLAITGLKPRC